MINGNIKTFMGKLGLILLVLVTAFYLTVIVISKSQFPLALFWLLIFLGIICLVMLGKFYFYNSKQINHRE
ncbi:hypothetical protein [Pseudoalteromonas sp. ZZD1]|uniref:hypothetical protein n=1 Tax=Pseudoalteromonas sp. ZZD1 TaxID=3139395 RepID=UPI003BADAF20